MIRSPLSSLKMFLLATPQKVQYKNLNLSQLSLAILVVTIAHLFVLYTKVYTIIASKLQGYRADYPERVGFTMRFVDVYAQLFFAVEITPSHFLHRDQTSNAIALRTIRRNISEKSFTSFETEMCFLRVVACFAADTYVR